MVQFHNRRYSPDDRKLYNLFCVTEYVIRCCFALNNCFYSGFFMLEHKKYIQRTFELARKGMGKVNPNPLVGAVIVKNNTIIGEGYHEQFGGAHAEVNAIKNATESVEGATLYVNLEPCSHTGKTPPCSDLIIRNKLSKVVIAMTDPNPHVSGRGIAKLRNAGIEVVENVLQKEAEDLNRVFIKYITSKTPYIVAKWAMTLDGKIASHVGDSQWVSNEKSRDIVQDLRNEFMGIMVGVNTIIGDDPKLTYRKKNGRSPIRIVMDSKLRIPMDSYVITHREEAETIIVHTTNAPASKKEILKELGVQCIETKPVQEKVDINVVLEKLGERGIDGILLEGGGTLNFSAFQAGVIDEVITFLSPKIIGGKHAKTPVEGGGIHLMKDAIALEYINVTNVDNDLMIRSKVKKEG